MKPNVGAFDGAFRTLLFIVSLCYAVLAGGAAWLLLIPTAILFATALARWCPLYEMIGVDTYSDQPAGK